MKDKAKIFMIFFPLIFLIILGIIILKQLRNNQKPNQLETIFVPSLTSTPTLTPQSRWSTDSGLIKIETDLFNLKKEIESFSFVDQSLNPPKLDFGLGF